MCMFKCLKISTLLAPGHSEMECYSLNSAIGTDLKRFGKAFWPGDWKAIARGARKNGDKPYIVQRNSD